MPPIMPPNCGIRRQYDSNKDHLQAIAFRCCVGALKSLLLTSAPLLSGYLTESKEQFPLVVCVVYNATPCLLTAYELGCLNYRSEPWGRVAPFRKPNFFGVVTHSKFGRKRARRQPQGNCFVLGCTPTHGHGLLRKAGTSNKKDLLRGLSLHAFAALLAVVRQSGFELLIHYVGLRAVARIDHLC